MRAKLDAAASMVLACPQCKGDLELRDHLSSRPERACIACGRTFTLNSEGVWSFMLGAPSFVIPENQRQWAPTQTHFEEWATQENDLVSYDEYMRQLDSVSEIYTEAFQLLGSVLDVGGYQGRLRHFLDDGTTYLSVDPFEGAFHGLDHQEPLLRAYPCLRNPCNFVQGQAEFLPVRSGSFDYVHMRSVLDHFFDPTLALYEARRTLVPGGAVLIGVHVKGGRSTIRSESPRAELLSRVRRKLRDEGLPALALAVARRASGLGPKDEHLWHPTYEQLLELIAFVGLEVEKAHWQRAPNDHVVYVLARRRN